MKPIHRLLLFAVHTTIIALPVTAVAQNANFTATFLATGTIDSSPVLTGTANSNLGGTRMLWYPRKAAFRAGRVSAAQWTDSLIGKDSAALGQDTTASGANSIAFGVGSVASGPQATAFGNGTLASGYGSTSMGVGTKASWASTAIGTYNSGLGSIVGWNATDPLFEIGNGSSATSRRNALTVSKNGNMQLQGNLILGGTLSAPSISTAGAITASSISTTNLSAASITSGGKNVVTANADGTVSLARGIKSNYFDGSLDGAHNFSFGPGTSSSGGGAVAMGVTTQALAGGAFAANWGTKALGSASTALGHGTVVHGYESLAIGRGTIAYGNLNFVGGWHSIATNYNSFVYGHHCQANSQAGGEGSNSDSFAIAMGSHSNANASHSVAIGYGASAEAYLSTAIGRSLNARTMYELNMGTFAKISDANQGWSEADALFRLGNSNDGHNRSDAITVLKNGQATFTNKAWKANPAVAPTTSNSNGEALVVEGHTRLKGKVVIEQAQGDISMGIYQ